MTHRQEYTAFPDGGKNLQSQVDRDYQEIPRILLQFVFRRPDQMPGTGDCPFCNFAVRKKRLLPMWKYCIVKT